jgi:Arc/MetJ-type ribon-helix-helix transcriptional regulator
MQIELPTEIEQIAMNAVSMGEYESVADFIAAAVRAKTSGELGHPVGKPIDAEDWERQFRDWAASHDDVEHFVDDSRESIYEGRGL